MKGIRYFGLYFLYPVCLLGTGFLGGAACMEYFYPGRYQLERSAEGKEGTELSLSESHENDSSSQSWAVNEVEAQKSLTKQEDSASTETDMELSTQDITREELLSVEVMTDTQTLNADTVYVLEEADLRNDSIVETTWKLPAKYIGMNREEFLEAMESYKASPPLEELKRGFVGLEVLSFSADKVVVQMNYEYVEPSNSFYLMVEDNYIIVYLEDRKTVYMDTEILLKELPEELQQDIIHVMFVPDERSLFDFLENYSS